MSKSSSLRGHIERERERERRGRKNMICIETIKCLGRSRFFKLENDFVN